MNGKIKYALLIVMSVPFTVVRLGRFCRFTRLLKLLRAKMKMRNKSGLFIGLVRHFLENPILFCLPNKLV